VNVRRPGEGDLDEVLALCRASDLAVYGDSDWTEAELREDWGRLEDLWVVELDGPIAGYASYEDRGRGRLAFDGYVQPELRGHGVGSRLVELAEERAAGAPAGSTLETGVLRGDAAANALLSARGYDAARHFFRMVIDLDAEPRPFALPDGVVIDPLDPADARAVHEALQESFADEWGFRPWSFEEFEEKRLNDPRFDQTLYLVAKDGDEVAGFALCDWKRYGDWGWVGSLGVRPAWRRRGLGEALLRAAFAELFRRGERRVALGVDVQNPTGAVRLYERAGMHVYWEAVVYRKEL
jgi:mycothiol synthase